MALHRILLVIDSAIAAILLYYFVTGLEDGWIAAFNILIWLALLAGIGVAITLALLLRARGQLKAANLLLLIPALPGLIYGLYVLMPIVLQPS